MMKKTISMLLLLCAAVCLVACGGKSESKEAPDLAAYYDAFVEAQGAENLPAVVDLDDEMREAMYPGISAYSLKQAVFKQPMISAVAYEFALVECENEADVEAVKGILQSRMDAQIDGGAWYPATIEGWKQGEIITNGNVVALIVAGEAQADAVNAFNDLFK